MTASLTEPTPQSVSRDLAGLLFFGTLPAPDAAEDALAPGERCRLEVERVARHLAGSDRTPDSLLVLDAVYDPSYADAGLVEKALADALPDGARPCLTLIPVLPGALGERGLALQGASAVEPVTTVDTARFPRAATAGNLVAVAGHAVDTDDDMVTQTSTVMDQVAERLAEYGAAWDDAVRFDVFYRAEGTKEGWAVNARERARRFTEPGPATTGIPVGHLPGRAKILLRTLAVRGARPLGLRAESWPEGHWDWPFHLPYKHGIGAADTAFIGGQVSLGPSAEVLDPDDLATQTETSIRNIVKVAAGLDKGPDSVLRLMAFYQHRGPESARTVREAADRVLGDHPYELSLIGLPYLAYERMIVEIEAELR
ncbi:RidA family protein [Streptomyces sp. NPDC090106]|uniref:RidA family protein n=1 Tax=Streptomyces sp. NPDC090106 TaxID=3365946 RepID=UPI0037F5C8FF